VRTFDQQRLAGRTCAFVCALVLVGCTGDGAMPHHTAPPPQARETETVDGATSVEGAAPIDPAIERLLRLEPSADDMEHLTETLLFNESEREFLGSMAALTSAGAPEVSILAADVVSTSLYVASASGVDVTSAIEDSLESTSVRTRRIVVRNLGQADSPQVRRWLLSRLEDDAVDEMQARKRTVAEEARLALSRLDQDRDAGRGATIGDALESVDAVVGEAARAPIGKAFELVVHVEAVTQSFSSISRLTEPFVTATCTIVPKGTDARVAVLRVDHAPIYGGGYLLTANARLYVRCRAIGKDRARVWFRASVE
jgi:hypothetical protein